MKKSILTLCTAVLAVLAVNGQTTEPAFVPDYEALYRDLPIEVAPVKPVEIPDQRVDLRDFGAKGDGVTLCTEAFEQAIEHLSKLGGGHLDVPQGVWLTGPIRLRSRIDLHLADNAVIFVSPDRAL